MYVDDLLVAGDSLTMIHEFKEEMVTKFEMRDLGKLTYYLGIEVHQNSEGTTLKQERYAAKILEEAGMGECNVCQIPMEVNLKLSKGQNEKSVSEKEYRRSIGCLRYLLHTHSDLSFVVGMLIWYMQEPRESHNALLKQFSGTFVE